MFQWNIEYHWLTVNEFSEIGRNCGLLSSSMVIGLRNYQFLSQGRVYASKLGILKKEARIESI